MVNVTELDQLLPTKRADGAVRKSKEVGHLNGRIPFDAWRAAGAEYVDAGLAAAIDTIRADNKWRPIFDGDSSAYGGDQSAGDLALCGELARLGLSALKIDTAFRASGRYREKWERPDYRYSTIGLVAPVATSAPYPAVARSLSSGGLLSSARGQLNASDVAPPPRDWVIDHMFLAGTSSVVGGFGGVSKTQLLIHASIALAIGSTFAGMSVRQGRVLFISGEEPQVEMERRINAVVRRENLSQSVIQQINDNIRMYSLVAEDIRFTAMSKDRVFQPTDFPHQIIQRAREEEFRLIVLDHIGLFHGGTDFSSKGEVTVTMNQINAIAAQTGAAVVFLAHSPKSAISKDEPDITDITGSSAFIDLSRAGFIMVAMPKKIATDLGISEAEREHHVGLTGIKANYAPKNPFIWFRRHSFDEVGVLEHVTPTPKAAATKSTFTLQGHIFTTVAATPGRYSKSRLRDQFQGVKKGPWKASKEQIAKEVDDMLDAGQLVNRAPTPAECKLYGHGAQVRHVLDIGQQFAGSP